MHLGQDGREGFQEPNALHFELVEPIVDCLPVAVGRTLALPVRVREEPSAGCTLPCLGWQPSECEVIRGLKVHTGLGDRAALFIDQIRHRIGEVFAAGIVGAGCTRCVDLEIPAVAKAAEQVVHLGRHGNQFVLGGRIEVWPAIAQRCDQRGIAVKHHTGGDQIRPRQNIANIGGFVAVFRKSLHWLAFTGCRRSVTRKGGPLTGSPLCAVVVFQAERAFQRLRPLRVVLGQ